MLVRVDHSVSTLQLSNITVALLPPNVTSVDNPWNKKMIASFKVQFKIKLLEWVLSQFDSSTTQRDLKNRIHYLKRPLCGALKCEIENGISNK